MSTEINNDGSSNEDPGIISAIVPGGLSAAVSALNRYVDEEVREDLSAVAGLAASEEDPGTSHPAASLPTPPVAERWQPMLGGITRASVRDAISVINEQAVRPIGRPEAPPAGRLPRDAVRSLFADPPSARLRGIDEATQSPPGPGSFGWLGPATAELRRLLAEDNFSARDVVRALATEEGRRAFAAIDQESAEMLMELVRSTIGGPPIRAVEGDPPGDSDSDSEAQATMRRLRTLLAVEEAALRSRDPEGRGRLTDRPDEGTMRDPLVRLHAFLDGPDITVEDLCRVLLTPVGLTFLSELGARYPSLVEQLEIFFDNLPEIPRPVLLSDQVRLPNRLADTMRHLIPNAEPQAADALPAGIPTEGLSHEEALRERESFLRRQATAAPRAFMGTSDVADAAELAVEAARQAAATRSPLWEEALHEHMNDRRLFLESQLAAHSGLGRARPTTANTPCLNVGFGYTSSLLHSSTMQGNCEAELLLIKIRSLIRSEGLPTDAIRNFTVTKLKRVPTMMKEYGIRFHDGSVGNVRVWMGRIRWTMGRSTNAWQYFSDDGKVLPEDVPSETTPGQRLLDLG